MLKECTDSFVNLFQGAVVQVLSSLRYCHKGRNSCWRFAPAIYARVYQDDQIFIDPYIYLLTLKSSIWVHSGCAVNSNIQKQHLTFSQQFYHENHTFKRKRVKKIKNHELTNTEVTSFINIKTEILDYKSQIYNFVLKYTANNFFSYFK